MPINHKALVLVLFSAICCSCQSLEPDDDNKTIVERPYCFHFTWLGPKYNEESRFKNATCGDIVKDDKTVPCVHPLVVTIENITYLCTKVNIENETSAVNQGCYKQTKNGHEIEVCACSSWAGRVPCNGSESHHLSYMSFIALSIAIYIRRLVKCDNN